MITGACPRGGDGVGAAGFAKFPNFAAVAATAVAATAGEATTGDAAFAGPRGVNISVIFTCPGSNAAG